MMRGVLRAGFIGFFCCVMHTAIFAQEIKVTSGFIQDSISIGEPVSYYLTARYPQSVMTLFPDSTYKFNPFEFSKKTFYPTKTTNGISYDSTVYELSTFEIERVQTLSLPVYVTTARDCTAYESKADSIYLIEQIKIPASDTAMLKNIPLKSNTLYERVRIEFNTFILMIVAGALLVAAIITWIFFGKRIIHYFKIKKLEKNYLIFSGEFNRQVDHVTKAFSREKTEHTLFFWKKYLEQLERKPYTKLTTREIVKLDSDSKLGTSLTAIDKAIYGHPEAINEPLAALKSIAHERYLKRREQIRHE